MHKVLTHKLPICLLTLFCFAFSPQLIFALPQGGTVVGGAGNATLNYTPNTLTVDQNVPRIITDWDSFSVGELETVNFQQDLASWIAVNRVHGGNPSHILGTITALGRVFLINPNGIIFGVNSRVDVAGLVASTLSLDMSDNDFINGTGQTFTFSGSGGPVVNYGTLRTLNAPGGYVALLGSSVKNFGTIEANLGTVVLAAGKKITLNLDPAAVISAVINLELGTDRNDYSEYAAVNNAGTITANGGKVILTADILGSVFTSAVNNDGIIEANSLQAKDGLVLLKSNQDVELNGTIEASGAIDVYAERNIILGRPIDDIVLSDYIWEYLSGSRSYKFLEFGYYYGDGTFKIPLSMGADIGKDVLSPTSGAGMASLPEAPDGLYVIFDAGSNGVLTFYQDAALNPDTPVGLDHLDLLKLTATGTEYWWEDQLNNGDQDFNDAVIDFVTGLTTISPPPALLDAPNIFLTANQGYIQQLSGDIYADNLMLSANTGMSGTGSNGGIYTHVNNLSAVNKTSGDVRVSNAGTMNIADLSGINGLLPGVTAGSNGILNQSVGGEVNIETRGAGADLNVEAPVESYGPVTFSADGNINHTAAGDVLIHNINSALGAPTNLASPSHVVGAYSDDRTVDVTWGLPDSDPGYGFTGEAGGSYSMAPGSQIVTQGGNANITANGPVTLALVDVQNGNAVITSGTSINDADGGSAPGDFDVIAHNIKLNAPVIDGLLDLGHPYDFSHLWDNLTIADPDSTVDPYGESFDFGTGDWTFDTTSATLADGDWWFHVATMDSVVQSPTAHIGPFRFQTLPPPPPEEETYYEETEEEFRVYYEILDPSQFVSVEPATKIGLYAYHPLTPADSSAFDGIQLDAGAYEFIDGNISLNRPAPYFGLIDEDQRGRRR